MGSRNVELVIIHGGWLPLNQYKLLAYMALSSHDVERCPSDQNPRRAFLSRDRMIQVALGEYLPDKVAKPKSEWSELEKAQSRHRDSREVAAKTALAALSKMGIIRRVRNASPGRAPAEYELLLDLLPSMQVEHLAAKQSALEGKKNFHSSSSAGMRSAEEGKNNFPSKGRTSSLLDGRKEEILPEKGSQTSPITTSELQPLNLNGEQQHSSKVTTLRGGGLENDEDEELPITLEEQRNRMMAALREAHPEEFQPTGTDDGIW